MTKIASEPNGGGSFAVQNVTAELLAKASSKDLVGGFPGGAVVENPPANAGDTGSSPGPGRSHMLQSD